MMVELGNYFWWCKFTSKQDRGYLRFSENKVVALYFPPPNKIFREKFVNCSINDLYSVPGHDDY